MLLYGHDFRWKPSLIWTWWQWAHGNYESASIPSMEKDNAAGLESLVSRWVVFVLRVFTNSLENSVCLRNLLVIRHKLNFRLFASYSNDQAKSRSRWSSSVTCESYDRNCRFVRTQCICGAFRPHHLLCHSYVHKLNFPPLKSHLMILKVGICPVIIIWAWINQRISQLHQSTPGKLRTFRVRFCRLD